MAGLAATNDNVIAGGGGKLQSPYGLPPFPPSTGNPKFWGWAKSSWRNH